MLPPGSSWAATSLKLVFSADTSAVLTAGEGAVVGASLFPHPFPASKSKRDSRRIDAPPQGAAARP